ncbi:MAG: 16S rRNA (adenine(1518)-N(6)/adenine(1519)-N(6))-dimethyltransferase RsmA [Pseudomonadales bacterium]|nr:16S rRNA (adenine(1518)-N(6)/adenine(1519)-N(6))-dimethyltransferase RsmA [Pseudomonadales bacterium]
MSASDKSAATSHKPRKRFGQNFLHDGNIITRLVDAIHPLKDDVMVEIGPGQAALTEPLLQRLQQLHVVELDRDLVELLTAQFATRALHIHAADALQFNFSSLMQSDQALRVVGNLPYNISTPLIFHLLSYQQRIQDMHFMLQLEVVDRLAAQPGSKTYGRLSVVTQYYCQVDKLFNVPAAAFFPPPKVMSAIVRLIPRDFIIKANNTQQFEQIVAIAFGQRRKTLRNNLKNCLAADQLTSLEQNLQDNSSEHACFLLSDRPEQLSVANFVFLSNLIDDIMQKH